MVNTNEFDGIQGHLETIKEVREDSDTHKLLQELAYREFLLFRHEADINWNSARWSLASWAVDNGMKTANLEDSINSRIQEEEIRISKRDGSDRIAAIKSLAEEIAKDYIQPYDGPYQGQYL